MRSDEFHETVSITIDLPKAISPGEANRRLKSLGARLDYDVYSFYREDDPPIWQSDIIAQLRLFLKGQEVYAQDNFDEIRVEYPLATIDSSFINVFFRILREISQEFEGELKMHGKAVSEEEALGHFDELLSNLMKNWGEEAGSRSLVIMIEQSYPR